MRGAAGQEQTLDTWNLVLGEFRGGACAHQLVSGHGDAHDVAAPHDPAMRVVIRRALNMATENLRVIAVPSELAEPVEQRIARLLIVDCPEIGRASGRERVWQSV